MIRVVSDDDGVGEKMAGIVAARISELHRNKYLFKCVDVFELLMREARLYSKEWGSRVYMGVLRQHSPGSS